MEDLIHKVLRHWDLVISFVLALISLGVAIYQYLKRRKDLSTTKTSEERATIMNDIRSEVYGLVGVAEELFGSIPKSGVSKLKYVLNKIKELCEVAGVEFDNRYWTDFINYIVNRSNNIKSEKAFEKEKADIIEKVKGKIPYFVEQADSFFNSIPDNLDYKVEYILKNISIVCEGYKINVFLEFDWKAYVLSLYEKDGVLNG